MQAWNARVREDNDRLRSDVDAPRRLATKPRSRPDLRFGELLRLWKNEKDPRPQSYVEVERATEDLIDYIGDVPVETLTSDMLMDYRDEARKLPATMPRADRALPFNERLARHEHSGTPRVSPPTLKKRVGSIQALLGFAHQQRWISQNVGTGVRITGYSRVARGRRSFMPGELAQLFSSDLFVRPDQLLVRRTDVSDVTLYWLFLFGLTSGARLEEVGQARVTDVKVDGEILYIDIDDVMDAGADPHLPDKSVKTMGSRRIIPIHEHVLALGFGQYVEALREAGSELLFPDLRPSTFGKLTKEASRRLNRYINAIVSTDQRLVFHSLRHRFKDEGRGVDVQERVLDQLCGHVPATVGGRYGDGADLTALKRSLDRLRFDSVDWPRLQTVAAAITWTKTVAEVVARAEIRDRRPA
jgi:integrase